MDRCSTLARRWAWITKASSIRNDRVGIYSSLEPIHLDAKSIYMMHYATRINYLSTCPAVHERFQLSSETIDSI